MKKISNLYQFSGEQFDIIKTNDVGGGGGGGVPHSDNIAKFDVEFF